MQSHEVLEWVKAIGSLIFSWPVVAAVVLIFFRKPLLKLIEQFSGPDVIKAKFGPVEIEREMAKLLEVGKETVNNIHLLHQDTAQEMDDLAQTAKRAVNELQQLSQESKHKMEELIALQEALIQGAISSTRIPVASILNLHLPQTWEGYYIPLNDRNYGKVSMNLYIEQIHGTEFSGTVHWKEKDKTLTRVKGEFLEGTKGFQSDNKWRLVEEETAAIPGIGVKFTETDFIQGKGVQLNGWYYGFLSRDRRISGLWFPTKNSQNPIGRFELEAA